MSHYEKAQTESEASVLQLRFDPFYGTFSPCNTPTTIVGLEAVSFIDMSVQFGLPHTPLNQFEGQQSRSSQRKTQPTIGYKL